MPARIEIIGVYQLPVTEELVRSQAEVFYGMNPTLVQLSQTRHQLESTVLVEVSISDADTDFDVADFTQENPELPRADWQVAWAEAFLSSDGRHLLAERWRPLPPEHNYLSSGLLHSRMASRRATADKLRDHLNSSASPNARSPQRTCALRTCGLT